MYSLYNYSTMFTDKVRMSTYINALKSVITPNSVLIDLGAGSGIFSLIACHLGAKKVYAIDPSPCIHIGKELAHINGFTNNIEWIQEDSRKVNIPEKADILLSDIRGALPFIGENIPIIADARDRFLEKGAHLLPLKDTVNIALVQNKKIYKDSVQPWGSEDFNLNLNPLHERHSHRWSSRVNPKKKHLISKPKTWTVIDYRTVVEPNIKNTITLTCDYEAASHGFYLWFDAEIAPDIGFSGGPGKNSPSVYGSAFFPWPKPVLMKPGDTAEIHLAASLVAGEYIWSWNTDIHHQSKGEHASQSFKQSTFHSEVTSIAQLKKRADSHVPQLTQDGDHQRCVLHLMDGNRSNEAIAWEMMQKFPNHFSTFKKALAFAGNVSEKFSL